MHDARHSHLYGARHRQGLLCMHASKRFEETLVCARVQKIRRNVIVCSLERVYRHRCTDGFV